METTITILDMEIDIVIDNFTPFNPGISSGPAEDCYPPEGGEVEWHIDAEFPGIEFIESALESNKKWYDDIDQQLYIEMVKKLRD